MRIEPLMKSLSIPAVLSLLPLFSVVGSTQAKPQLDQQLHTSQPVISEVNEAKSPAPETPAAIAAEAQPTKIEQPTQAEQPATQVEQPEIPSTVPLYDPTDPRHSINDNCPACGMG
jgi:hypothetical protein